VPDPVAAIPGLAEALAAAPDPDPARRRAERVLEAAAPVLAAGAGRAGPGLVRVLAVCCGVAPFLAGRLIHHPEWLAALAADDLVQPLSAARLGPWLDDALAAAPDAEAEAVLRAFKYRWLARITVRDCTPERVPLARSGETLTELTALAEVLLDRALVVARRRVAARLGPPGWGGPEEGARLCVLGLGKLGGEELNYSSDVDLVYVCETVARADAGPQERSPADYWTRVVQEFSRLVGTETADGFLYRIDLDLRPEGAQGPPVVAADALVDYYETAADHWEKVAFMKARPVAGDLALGWRAVRAVHPMIYQASMDYAGVRRIRDLKEKIGAVRGGGTRGFDVKLDPGGIRDVEFAAQALQLLHGGRIEQLRDRSTQRALERLAEVRLLPAATAAALLDAYRFLRRVENRLQMEEERQVHRLPERPEALERLARAVGFGGADAVARFRERLEEHRRRVLDVAAGFGSEAGRETVLSLFARHQPALLANPASRPLVESLAERFARALEEAPDPPLALNNLDRFVEGLGARRFYYELLIDRPELVDRLTALFASSRFLSGLLARHPRLIEPLFADPNVLLLTRAQLRDDLAALRAQMAASDRDPYERELDVLRLFHHRQVLNVGLLDVDEKVSRAACERALTEVAEVTLEAGLALARDVLERGRPPGAAAFLVLGMGKLASAELTYGSDLDLVFLYDLPEGVGADAVLEAQEDCVRLAQRLISVLETPTAEGICYEIDSRLRPSGNQGTLVTSLGALAAYHAGSAQTWERQALLRARPVAGEPRAAAAFEALRREILLRPLPGAAAAEIHHIRQRMETELARETSGRRDVKRGRGGLLDVETATQFLQLRHAAAHPELLEVERTEAMIDRLAGLGILTTEQAAALRGGWEFLQRLASRLRILENRSISDLDAGSSDLGALARRLGYAPGAREASARGALLRDYTRHTEAIRRAYLEILGAGS
jgi:glutamate-ammonia-ligase adenylyltransferase